MKKIISLIILLFFISSCNDEIDDKLKSFVYDLIENPEKIINLNKFYPNYYNYEFSYKGLFGDSIQLKRIENNLRAYFNKNDNNFKIKKINDSSIIDIFKKQGYSITKENCYSYNFQQKLNEIYIIFRKENNQYFIFFIDVGPIQTLENDNISP